MWLIAIRLSFFNYNLLCLLICKYSLSIFVKIKSNKKLLNNLVTYQVYTVDFKLI